MRIIREGKEPDDTFTGRCSTCTCEFEFTRSESRGSGHDQRDNVSWLVVECPCCKRMVYVYI